MVHYLLFYQSLWKGSSDQALKMISIWMVLCIIIPGTVHQITSLKYPTNYTTDHLDVSREPSNNIFNLPEDDQKGLIRRISIFAKYALCI